jgi:hypothetical protein
MALHHSPRIVTNGLVLCLDAGNRKSYSGSGNVWRDLAGYNNGDLTNGPTFSSANGGSLVFDGTNDSVLLNSPSIQSLNITNNITLEAKVRLNVYHFGGIIVFGSFSGEQYSLNVGFSGNTFMVGTNWPSNWYTVDSTSNIITNVWYHVVATFVSGLWTIYINGTFNNSSIVPISLFPQVQSSWLSIGNNQPGGQEYFNGNIAQVSIYNRALTPAEIQQNYNATKGRYKL